jgi:hypothetical protein
MPFSIAEIVNDPDFAQSFTITRSSGGQYVMGRWNNKTVLIQAWGAIQPPSPEELEQVPEADRVTGVIAIWTSQLIYETSGTSGNTGSRISDIVTWQGENYRVVKVGPWQDYGYRKAYAVRMSGQ